MAINGIGSVGPAVPSSLPVPKPAGGEADKGFGDALNTLIQSVDGTAADANTAIGKVLDGTGDVHEAVIALQKADTALQLTVQVRNKLVQAYQDIMRMPM